MSALAPESFNLSSLPSLPLSDKGKLPSCAAVYFALSSQGRVLYIGRSINLQERLRGHHRLPILEAFKDVKIAWLKQSGSLALQRIETIMIKYFNPPLNKIPSYLKDEDTEKLVKYLTLSGSTHKNNVIPINKLLTSESNLPLPLEERGLSSEADFKAVVLEQANKINYLEETIADLRLMVQEQMQAHRQLTETIVEQAKTISELSRTQTEAHSRLVEVTVAQANTISILSRAVEETGL